MAPLLPFLIAVLSISKSKSDADAHKTEWGKQKNQYSTADGALAVLGRAAGIRVAHCAALTEGGYRPHG